MWDLDTCKAVLDSTEKWKDFEGKQDGKFFGNAATEACVSKAWQTGKKMIEANGGEAWFKKHDIISQLSGIDDPKAQELTAFLKKVAAKY